MEIDFSLPSKYNFTDCENSKIGYFSEKYSDTFCTSKSIMYCANWEFNNGVNLPSSSQ